MFDGKTLKAGDTVTVDAELLSDACSRAIELQSLEKSMDLETNDDLVRHCGNLLKTLREKGQNLGDSERSVV